MELTPQQQAAEIWNEIQMRSVFSLTRNRVQEIALYTVQMIIAANPHSNPINTDGESTMAYWLKVKEELEKM